MNNFLRLFTEANSRKASPDPFGGLTAMAERQEGTLALPHKSIERQTASLLFPLESPPSGEWWSQHSLSPSSFPCSSPQDGGLLICLVGAWLPREPVSLLDEMTGHSSPVAGRLVLFDHPGSGKDSPLLLLSLSTDLFGRACSTRGDTCHTLCAPAPPALQKQPWNWHGVDWRLPSRFGSLCRYKGFYLAWEAGDTILASGLSHVLQRRFPRALNFVLYVSA